MVINLKVRLSSLICIICLYVNLSFFPYHQHRKFSYRSYLDQLLHVSCTLVILYHYHPLSYPHTIIITVHLRASYHYLINMELYSIFISNLNLELYFEPPSLPLSSTSKSNLDFTIIINKRFYTSVTTNNTNINYQHNCDLKKQSHNMKPPKTLFELIDLKSFPDRSVFLMSFLTFSRFNI